MPEGISVGSVTVDIVPDTRKFRRDLQAKTQDITVDVDVRLRDKTFEAELKTATRDRTVDVKVDDKGSINKMQGRTHALLTTLTLLAPAAAPLTAVAIGGTAALGALGAAGILAFKGIQAEIAAGSPVGLQYNGIVLGITKDLKSLELTAASGVLDGVNQSAALLNGQLPEARAGVEYLSKSLGSDLAPVTDGLISLFRDLAPTIGTVSTGVHTLAVDFETWANGPGGRAFASYLAAELPVVAHTLEALGQAGAHVVSALLPLGGPVLTAIRLTSEAIAHIPVTVVQDLFIAFAAYKTILLAQSAVEGFTGALVKLGIVEKGLAVSGAGGTAGGIASKSGAFASLGPLGLVAGAGALLFGTLAESKSQDASDFQKQVNSLAGNPAKLKQQQALLKSLQAQRAGQLAAGPGLGSGGQTVNLGGATFRTDGAAGSSDLGARIQDLKKLTDAAAKAAPKIQALQAANLAMGLNAAGTKDAITGESVALASLISNSDKLASAAQHLAVAQIEAHQAFSDAEKALKANGRTLDLNTQKGRDNRTALLNMVTAQREVIDADATTAAGRKRLNSDTANSILQIQNMAIKFGLSGTAAHKYALQLLGIPNSVVTSVTVNGIAKSEKQIKALKKLVGAAQFTAGQRGGATGGLFDGTRFHYDTGGLVQGAGTGTSDSIQAPWLSNGEFVVKAATVKQLGVPFLQTLNQGKPAAAMGGQPMAVYVQNPWTGEYMLAKTTAVVDGRMGTQARAAGRSR